MGDPIGTSIRPVLATFPTSEKIFVPVEALGAEAGVAGATAGR